MNRRFHRVLASALLLAAAGPAAFAAPLDEARALLQAGKPEGVEPLLAPLLQQEPPSVEALGLSLLAARQLGHVYTAERRARELIRLEGTKNPRWIALGAEVGRDLGDETLYLERLHFYVRQQKEKTPDLEKALRVLSLRGIFPDAFRQYREQFGKEKASFAIGMDLLRRLRESAQPALYLEHANDLLTHYRAPEQIKDVHREFLDLLDRNLYGFKRDDVHDVMFKHPVHDIGLVQGMVGRFDIRLDALFALQEAYGKPLPMDLLNRFENMDRTESETLRLQYGRQYLKHEALYRTQGSPELHRRYVDILFKQPKTFLSDKERLLQEDAAVAIFQALAARFPADASSSLGPIGQKAMESRQEGVSGRYIESDAKRHALLRAVPQAFWAGSLRQLLQGVDRDPKAVEALFALAGQRHDVRMECLEILSRNGQRDLLLETVRQEFKLNPTRFNEEILARHFLSSDAVDTPTKLQVLGEAYRWSGYGSRLRSLVTRNDHRNRNEQAFKDFVATLKDDARAADPVLAHLVEMHRDGKLREGKEPKAEFTAKIQEAFKAYGAPYPTAGKEALQNHYLREALNLYADTASRSREGRREYARVVSPLLSKDADWDAHIDFAIWDRDGLAAFHVASRSIPATGAYKPVFRFIEHPAKDATPLLKPFYATMGGEEAVEYLARNRDRWTPEFLAAQAAEVIQVADLSQAQPQRLREVIERLRKNPAVKADFPMDRLQKAFFTPDKEGRMAGDAELRAQLLFLRNDLGQTEAVARALTETAAALEPVDAVNFLLPLLGTQGLVSEEDPKAEPQAGFRKHFLVNVVAPALAKVNETEASRLRLPAWIHEHLNWHRGRSEVPASVRDAYAALQVRMVGLMANGAGFEPNFSQAIWGVHLAVDDAIARADYPHLVKLVLLAGKMSHPNVRRNEVEGLVTKLREKNLYQPLFLLANTFKGGDAGTKAFLAQVRSQSASHVPGIHPVDEKDPAYPLYLAADELQLNNEERAWSLLRDHLAEFAKDPTRFPHDFMAWGIEKLRQVKGEDNVFLERSRELANLALAKEAELAPEVVASLMLTRAEIFRDLKNFDAARLEYQSLRGNPQYQRTPAGRRAMFRDVDLMIAMGNTTAAEGLLEYWLANPDADLQAQAHYFQALIAFNNGDYPATRENLDKVFAIQFTHTEARLLHGEWRLKTNYEVDNPEVLLGDLRDRTILRPGQQFRVTVQDQNLSVVGGGAAIPVLVKTVPGGDLETIQLYPSTRDPKLFRGVIDTRLAGAVVTNRVLEVKGMDEVSYEIHPEFLRQRSLPPGTPKVLRVVDDGRLTVGSGQLLTETEQQEMEIQRQMSGQAGQANAPGTNVRPGNPIYVMVRDRDRSVSNARDTVTVAVETRSGDKLPAFKLQEVEPHSGIFRGQIPTDLPPPRASASDSAEGTNPGDVINSRRAGLWRSRPDGKPGKWIQADTMNSHVISQSALRTPDAAAIAEVRLWGMLSDNKMELLGSLPERSARAGGVEMRSSGARVQTLAQYREHFATVTAAPTALPGFRYQPKGDGFHTVHVTGAFWLPEARDVTLNLMPTQPKDNNALQDLWLFLLVDGEVVASGRGSDLSRQGFALPLPAGGHYLEVFASLGRPRDGFALGVQDAAGVANEIPAEWFSVATHPQLVEFLKDKARITRGPDGFTADFPEPKRFRTLRWEFARYSGDSLAVSELRLVDAEKRVILPAEKDFTDALGNEVVEIAPGDQITVTYLDDVTTDGMKRTLRDNLSSSFSNGMVGFFFEELVQTKQGMQSNLHSAYRFQPGDSFMVVVTDPDADLGPAADVVEIQVSTRSGEKLLLKAEEQSAGAGNAEGGVHGGRFRALLRTSLDKPTGGDTLRVRPGDMITAAYLDRENTVPGIPFLREVDLASVQELVPEPALYHTWRERIEDKSDAAKEKVEQIRKRTGNQNITSVFAWSMFAMPMSKDDLAQAVLPVNADAPLPVEVYHPARALHSGSFLWVEAVTQTELDAAKAENREPVVLRARMGLGRGLAGMAARPNPKIAPGDLPQASEERAIGTFGSALYFKLGGGGDELALQTQEAPDLLGGNRGEGGGTPPDRTLLVQGNDRVHLKVIDAQGKEVFAREIQLVSEASIALLDSTFEAERTRIHLGERYFVQVQDTDRDVSPALDEITVTVATTLSNLSTNLILRETLPHSGLFTGMIRPEFVRTANAAALGTAGGGAITNDLSLAGIPTIGVAFGDTVSFSYQDEVTLPIREPRTFQAEGRIFDGSDGRVHAFTKHFADPNMAVRVQFRLAECLFEMAKDFRKLKQADQASAAIADGKRILEEALQQYPDTTLVVEGEYLLANLYQELAEEEEKENPNRARELNQEALSRFSAILSTWPDSEFAARSQYHKALCLEKLGDFDRAGEEYVKMTYIFPESPLVGEAAIRLATHYYKNEQRFDVAGKIYANFFRRFSSHELAPKALFMSAQCHMKQAEIWETERRAQGIREADIKTQQILDEYGNAVKNLHILIEEQKDVVDKDVRAQAMYWAGDASLRGLDYPNAYLYLKRTTFEYPESEWARRARGLLMQAGDVFKGLE